MSSGAARTGLAIGGGVAGFLIGGPLGASIGFTLGNAVGGIFFGDDPAQGQTITGPRLQDLQVTTSTYGKGIPITFGSVRVGGNMIWATDIVEVRKDEVIEQEGGKGQPDPPSAVNQTFEYFGNFALGFAEGEAFVRRIWANGTLIVDLSDEFAAGTSRFFKYGSEHYRIYTGNETQLPDSLIEADKGVGNVPGFRGLVYVVFDGLPLRDFGNRIPQISAEIVKVATSAEVAINADVLPQGGLFGRDSDFMDQSGRTPLGYNEDGGLTVFNRFTRQQVDRLDPSDIPGLVAGVAASGIVGTPIFQAGKMYVDRSSGMLSIAVGVGNPGGVGLHTGVISTLFAENPAADLRDGSWQYVRSDSANVKMHRVYRIDGVRFLFMAEGLVNFNRLVAVPFQKVLIGGLSLELVKTTGTTTAGSGSPSGTAIPDGVVTLGAGIDWVNAAYDPVNQRAWFISDEREIVKFEEGAFSAVTDLDTVLPVSSDVGGIAYDVVNEVLVLALLDDHFTLNPDTFAIIQQAGPNTTTPVTDVGAVGHTAGFTNNMWDNQDTIEKFFHEVVAVTQLARWNTDDISTPFRRYDDGDFTGDPWLASEGPLFDPALGAFYITGGTSTWGFVDRFQQTGENLGSVVNDLVARTGVIGAADTDVVALTDTVRGFVIDSPGTIRSMLDVLRGAFFFDGIEVDGELVFKKRDGASLLTVPNSEIGVKAGSQTTAQALVEPRKQETEVPRQIDVSYMNPDNDYQIGTQRDQRIQDDPGNAFAGITRSRQTAELRLPIVLTDQEAREVAAMALDSASVERTSLEFTLPPKFAFLDPGDIITVQKVSSFLTADIKVRLVKVDMGEAGVLRCVGLLTESAVFSPSVTAQAIDGSPAGAIAFPAGTNMFLLNLPNLRGNADEDGGAWWAAAPKLDVPNPAWRGAVLFKALTPDGARTQVDATFSSQLWGVLRTTLPPPPDAGGGRNFTTRERTQTLQVTLQVSGALSTISDTALFNGGNLAYIPSTGELLQFQEAVLAASGIYTLSVFLRGRLGTEVFVADTAGIAARTAPISAEIVFLGDLSSLLRFSDFNDRNLERTYEAVTVGAQVGDASTDVEQFTNVSAAQIPLSISSLRTTRDGSDNLDVTWFRRTRFNGNLVDLTDVALNEVGEFYEVDLLDNPAPGAGVVVRTFTGIATNAFEYTIANQQADFAHDTDFPLDVSTQVVNNGFEVDGAIAISGSPTITGWNGPRGTNQDLGVASADSGSVPDTGSFFAVLRANINNDPFFSSDPIPLGGGTPPFSVANVDVQPGRFQITVTQRVNHVEDATGDLSGINVAFLDGDFAVISTIVGTLTAAAVEDVWENRTIGPVDIPFGARYVRVTCKANEAVPANTRVGWDGTTVTITDTDAAAPQAYTFDVYQISDSVARGRARRAILPALGQDQT